MLADPDIPSIKYLYLRYKMKINGLDLSSLFGAVPPFSGVSKLRSAGVWTTRYEVELASRSLPRRDKNQN